MAIDAAARVLIIADDLTGAFDTAGAFASRGIATKVVAQPSTSDAESVRDAQVVAINTASRHLPAADAAVHMLQCALLLSTQDFDIVFKKIDSTLRGNVVAETETLMKICDRRSALVAPAFPAQGRTVINGVVHVEGVPLPDTGFARDALSPPPLQPLDDVFAGVIGQSRVRSWRPGEVLTLPDSGIAIADAENDRDMNELFGKVADKVTETLLVGSAGLGEMLAARLGGTPREVPLQEELAEKGLHQKATARIEPVAGPILFVVGSRASRSREQVEQLRRQPQTVLIDAPNGETGAMADTAGAQQIVLLAVEDPESTSADAEEVAHRMAQTGLEVAAFNRAAVMVVTGGDTAMALLIEAGCTVIDVCGNLMPGIPYSRFDWKGRPMHLVTKAGGFGTRDTFVDIVRCFRGGAG